MRQTVQDQAKFQTALTNVFEYLFKKALGNTEDYHKKLADFQQVLRNIDAEMEDIFLGTEPFTSFNSRFTSSKGYQNLRDALATHAVSVAGRKEIVIAFLRARINSTKSVLSERSVEIQLANKLLAHLTEAQTITRHYLSVINQKDNATSTRADESKRQREYLLAKRLSQLPSTFCFAADIYQRIYDLVSEWENPGLAHFSGYLIELMALQRYQRLFAHSDHSVFTPQTTHGSVGEYPSLFFKKLPQKPTFYFDVLVTCITNSIFQYGFLRECAKRDSSQVYLKRPMLEELRRNRLAPTAMPPTLENLNIPYEELQGRFDGQNDDRRVRAQGEYIYQIGWCEYTERANRLQAPVVTGVSSTSYLVFKCLAVNLKLSEIDMIELRRCLVAYMVAAHDHSLIEILDGINEALIDDDFKKRFEFDTTQLFIQLSSVQDYEQAVEEIFFSVLQQEKTTLQINCESWLNAHMTLERGDAPSNVSTARYLQEINRRPQEWCHQFVYDILNTNPSQLHKLFAEDQAENTVTALEGLIDLYHNSRFANLPIKILTQADDPHLQRERIQNFGFTTTRHGSNYPLSELARQTGKPKEAFNSLPPLSTQAGTGSILATRGQTLLLEAVWLLASVEAGHDFYLDPTSQDSGSTGLARSVNLLLYVGYQLDRSQDFGIMLRAPANVIIRWSLLCQHFNDNSEPLLADVLKPTY